MARDHDIRPFLDDPSLLTETFREVIKALVSSGEDDVTHEKEAQLREIAKGIEQLEKAGVPVLDVLRGEKTRLAAELAMQSERLAVLNRLADEMEEILRDLKAKIGRSDKPAGGKKRRQKRPRSGKEQTPQSEFARLIPEALRELGGVAECNAVLAVIEEKIKGKLLPGDLEYDERFQLKWRHNAHWARLKLVKDGVILKKSSRGRGYWELSEDQQ